MIAEGSISSKSSSCACQTRQTRVKVSSESNVCASMRSWPRRRVQKENEGDTHLGHIFVFILLLFLLIILLIIVHHVVVDLLTLALVGGRGDGCGLAAVGSGGTRTRDVSQTR